MENGDAVPWYWNIGRVAACGPFSLMKNGDSQQRGCGPLFTAVMDEKGEVTRFGVGWAVGLGMPEKDPAPSDTGEAGRAGFGVGFGLLFDTNAKTIDSRVIDTSTMLVKPQYQAGVAAGTTDVLVNRPTTSLFLMVSKTF